MTREAERHTIAGRPLRCPICEHDRFHSRRTTMSSRGLAFFDFEWLGKGADNYVCERCGYVYWFLPVARE